MENLGNLLYCCIDGWSGEAWDFRMISPIIVLMMGLIRYKVSHRSKGYIYASVPICFPLPGIAPELS